ncbi:conserved hypothetical protein [Vibrio parahaemolyticus Peru-466]|nr:conserved hypothetical protein [Vibrio parahaemolyticus Peru-466]EFO42318.1 conserved hypothetical protein [Vibrio parahaemolyticus AN-5034]EFO49519.1 conserved hypothetical protein [Vibrio parahaemolyticus K5030]ETY36723.1 hypothetical protein D039_1258 [Vibrio parahaemolyticus EKP-028]EVU15058.1 hypothetical protein D046_4660 [Vibrio parahaemolyticus V-223/04]
MANLAKLLVHLCGALTVNIVLSRSRAKKLITQVGCVMGLLLFVENTK